MLKDLYDYVKQMLSLAQDVSRTKEWIAKRKMKQTLFTVVLLCSILFAPAAEARSRNGKYIYSFRDGKRIDHNIIELKTKGVVLLKSPRTPAVRGTYWIKGNDITFKFKAANVISDSGRFIGNDLYTYLKAVSEEDDPGEYDDRYPNGYKHKKSQ